MKKLYTFLILVVTLVSVFTACSTTPSQTTTSAQTPTSTQTTASVPPTTSAPATLTPKSGGVLKIVVKNPSNYFGYPGDMASSGAVEISMPCLEQLVQLDARGQFDPTGLVTAYQAAPDDKSITFTLRKGVKFHDGTDFNAQAVKWCLERGMKARLAGTELWNSIDAVDDYNIRINAQHVDNRLWAAVADAKVSSPAAFEKWGVNDISTHPVGTGPFKFVSFTPDVGVTWERFDDYWGGKPYLDGIQSIFMADDMARAAAIQAGDVDILFNISADIALDLRAKGYTVAEGNTSTLRLLMPDDVNADSPLSNLLVRQAAEYAIDRSELAKLGSGFWLPAYQNSTPTSPGYITDFEGRRYNIGKARELLAQAGYPKGFDISITIASTQMLEDQVVSIQQMLSMAGIKVDVQSVPGNVRTNYLKNGWHNGFQVQQIYSGPIAYLPGLNYQFGPSANYNVSCARPTGWQEAMNEAFYADPAGLDAACRRLNTILYENATLIPLYVAPQIIYVTQGYVHDAHIYEKANNFYWAPEKAWLSK